MGRRCAFSARKRSEARRPAEVLPRVKPQRVERVVVRRRRRSKGMPRRGELVVICEGRGGGGIVVSSVGEGGLLVSSIVGCAVVAILAGCVMYGRWDEL